MDLRQPVRRLLPVLTLATTFACQRPAATGGSEVDAVATSRVWPTATLRVCFDGTGQTSTLGDLRPFEQAIAAAVQRNYRPETTGVSFTGFFSCDQGASDVRIAWITDAQYPLFGVASHIGTIDSRNYPDFSGPDIKEFFKGIDRPTVALWTTAFSDTQQKLSKNGATAIDAAVYTALHELGHIAGLFHEHAALDSTCKASDESVNQRFEVFPDIAEQTYLAYGAYDPYSVMSYCYGTQALGIDGMFPVDPSIDLKRLPGPSRIGLSATDQEALRALYGSRQQSGAQAGGTSGAQAGGTSGAQAGGTSGAQAGGTSGAQAARTSGLPAGVCQVTADTQARFCLACGDGFSSSSSCVESLTRQIDVARDCSHDGRTLTCSDGTNTLSLSY